MFSSQSKRRREDLKKKMTYDIGVSRFAFEKLDVCIHHSFIFVFCFVFKNVRVSLKKNLMISKRLSNSKQRIDNTNLTTVSKHLQISEDDWITHKRR